MAEYIEREAAYREICTDDTLSGYDKAYCCEIIKAIPATDVAPVRHARWLEVREKRLFGEHYFLCSNCKSRNGLMIPFNYCNNCGCKMDG